MGTDIPMVNGVVYYWRVGSSVTPSGGGGQCGQNWNYSDTWEYMKRPPYPQNITFSAEQTTVTLSWDHPVNCSGTSPAVSYPPVPPNGGDYIVYVLDQANGAPDPATDRPRAIVGSNTTTVQITDLQADTTYTMCVAAVDDTHYYTNVGHVSRTICIAVTTAPEEE